MKIRDFLCTCIEKIRSKFALRFDKNEFRGYKTGNAGMLG
ncbi:Type I-B CRISPR-associated protein Cas5 [Chryseobacterium sp. IT-36CA2]